MSLIAPSFDRYFMEIERVEKLLLTVTSALSAAGIRYAVIGGHAVAAWVATRDQGATRNTKDVDLLVDRADLQRIGSAVAAAGLLVDFAGSVPVLLDRSNPLPSLGVHLLFAGEHVRASEAHAAPSLDCSVQSDRGYPVIDLPSLVTMKLVAFRRHDQVHLEDLIRVGLITPEIRARIPQDLISRLEEIEGSLPQG